MMARFPLWTLGILGFLCSCALRAPAAVSGGETTPSYPEIFQLSRELYKERVDDAQNAALKPLKKFAESDLVAMMRKDPSLFRQSREKLLEDIVAESKNSDPSKHLRLMPPPGSDGYSELTFEVSHAHYYRGNYVKAANLIHTWSSFLDRARSEIILNVFDFDLTEIAELLAKKAAAGLSVTVGIDAKVVKARPEVAAVFEALKASGVNVVGVNSVGLNHQKMAAIDWSDPAGARVLFSSGNLTRSCLHPLGDLVDVVPHPALSIPNANHVITMKSWLLANLVQHELSKTLDQTLRGSQYPLNGAYQVTGPGVDPGTLEAYPEKSVIVTFTPGGGYRSVNGNLLARLIENTSGPVRMIQFAYSAEAVSQALLVRADREFREHGTFDFLSIGDTPFAMQDWSQFLKMSGWKLDRSGTRKVYVEDSESPWLSLLGPEHLKWLRSRVRIAPKIYGNSSVTVGGKSYKVSSKIHHKILTTGDFAVVGTSFNFSQGAETNNEQILVFKDPDLVAHVDGMAEWLDRRSPSSVDAEARRRNQLPNFSSDPTLEFEDLPADYVVPEGPKSPEAPVERSVF